MRYKEFNPNRVLEKCLRLFWLNGFSSCAISDIVKETNVNRFSLYEEFDNKEGILYATIELYKQRYAQDKLSILKEEGEVEDILEKFYLAYFENTEEHPPGCFIIHISTEITDEVIARELDTYIVEMENRLKALLERNQDWVTDSKIMARQLLGLFCTAVSFCVIQSESQRLAYIKNGMNIILKAERHAQAAQ